MIESRKKTDFGGYAENYTKFLLTERHLIFTLAWDIQKDRPMGFSGVFNGGRYSKGVFRVLNRTWTAPAFRLMGKNLTGLQTRIIFKRHFKAIQNKAKVLFFSMEGAFVSNKIKIISQKLEETSQSPWALPSGFYQVAPGNLQSCWQKTAYTLLDKSSIWNLKQKSLADWRKLPKRSKPLTD